MKKIYLILACMSFMACNANAATLNLTLYIEGYYIGSGYMNSVMFNEGVCPSCINQVDTIVVELHNTIAPYTIAASFTGILSTVGTIACTFSNSVVGNAYYIGVRHRNAIQTWSAAPVSMSATTVYNFSTANSKAYANNMVLVDASNNIWAFYNGDINQDGNIDMLDYVPSNICINNGCFGYYASDLNGDGNVDLLDFPVLDENINLGIWAQYP